VRHRGGGEIPDLCLPDLSDLVQVTGCAFWCRQLSSEVIVSLEVLGRARIRRLGHPLSRGIVEGDGLGGV